MKNIIFSLLTLFFITGTINAGGPWVQQKGKGYFKFSEWWTVYDQHYTDTGQKDPNVTTGIFNTSLYVEYGFTNRLTGIFSGPIFSRNYMNNLISSTNGELLIKGEAINSLGDFDIGFKYSLTKPGSVKIPISASFTFGLPTGKTNGGTQGNLQTGDGEFNQMIQIDAGTGFNLGKNVFAYANAFAAFNNRTQGFSEEFRLGIEAGVGLFNKKLWIITRLSNVESLQNGETVETIMRTSIFANNTEYTSLGLEANYYISDKIGVSASITSALRGEIIAASPSYSIGIFLDLSK